MQTLKLDKYYSKRVFLQNKTPSSTIPLICQQSAYLSIILLRTFSHKPIPENKHSVWCLGRSALPLLNYGAIFAVSSAEWIFCCSCLCHLRQTRLTTSPALSSLSHAGLLVNRAWHFQWSTSIDMCLKVLEIFPCTVCL